MVYTCSADVHMRVHTYAYDLNWRRSVSNVSICLCIALLYPSDLVIYIFVNKIK